LFRFAYCFAAFALPCFCRHLFLTFGKRLGRAVGLFLRGRSCLLHTRGFLGRAIHVRLGLRLQLSFLLF
jgi:hypothetical protein